MQDKEELLDEDYTPDILTLSDEDGKEFSFEVVDAADFNDTRYLAVVPYAEGSESLEEDSDLIIMRVCDEGDDEYLDVVDDDDELSEIGAKFAERLSDIYDIDTADDGTLL